MAQEQMDENTTATADETTSVEDISDLPIEGSDAQSDRGPSGEAGSDKPQPQVEKPQPQATPADGDGAPQWWKPDLFKLKYRGAEVSPKDYNHAVQLMQKGWSYEQAMASVNQQKQEFETGKKRFADYERLEEAFKKNPAFAQRIQQMYLEATQGQRQPVAGQQQYQHGQQLAPELVQKLTEFESFKTRWEEQQADSAVQDEMGKLKAQFPDEKWDAVTETGFTLMRDVLKHALDNRFPNIASAYRDYTYDRVAANAKMQGAEQVAKARQQQVRQGVISSGAAKPAPRKVAVDVSKLSYDELSEMAKREAGVIT